MFTTNLLPELLGLVAMVALIAYAVLGGADFGGGVWNLLARGSRGEEQRRAIAVAMGPVWEANHVWLIFLIVILFTAFPLAFAALSVAFFWPFHLVLAGIVLRGAAFVFRAHGRAAAGTPLGWGAVFGAASVITPLLLGACLGAVSTGQIRAIGGIVQSGVQWAWIGLFPLATAVLALVVCAYLAAVYLTLETEGELREDFRRRALIIWLIAGVVSLGTLLLAYSEAPHLWEELMRFPAILAVLAGVIVAPAAVFALWRRHFELARVLAVGQVALLLIGWGLAQRPYIIYPDISLSGSAAPPATLIFVLWTLPFGLALLLPSLWFLFVVFKGRNPAAEERYP